MEIRPVVLRNQVCQCIVLESNFERMFRLKTDWLPLGTVRHGIRYEYYTCVNCEFMWEIPKNEL